MKNYSIFQLIFTCQFLEKQKTEIIHYARQLFANFVASDESRTAVEEKSEFDIKDSLF